MLTAARQHSSKTTPVCPTHRARHGTSPQLKAIEIRPTRAPALGTSLHPAARKIEQARFAHCACSAGTPPTRHKNKNHNHHDIPTIQQKHPTVQHNIKR